MKRSVHHLPAGSRLGALLAFLIAWNILPVAARASCSAHYVTSRAQIAMEAIDVDLLRSAGALADIDGESPDRRPTPCSGAFCSGNRTPLSSSIDSTSTSFGGPWAISPVSMMLAAPGSSPCPSGDAIGRPVGHCRSIFHPPPASASLLTV